ncbi:hypothetical protein SORBI_3002G007700 [Sorghum bicolor]|uniref:Uncharacterized protein n=2 Tax=Sorghum bicolor TaxID=4558 RepID=C5X785_SORBI|nr:hypothetical protein SORBI_3002G007700 [Sorghum bicolor]
MAAFSCGHATAAILGGVQFAVRVLCGRWFMLFASTMIMSMSGGAYIFGAYSKALKASLQYDQDTLNTISFSKNIGISLGIVSGLINEVTPPWVVLLAGAAMNLAGYLLVHHAVSKPAAAARPPAVWLMCFYIFLGAISQTFASTGSLVTSVKNFPNDRGIVLGMLLGYAGFSGAIFTQLYRAFGSGGEDGATLLLILAWLPTVVSLLFCFTVRVIPRISSSTAATAMGLADQERKGVLGFLRVSVLIGIYLLILNVMEVKVPRLSTHVYHITNTLLLFVLVVGPLIIVVKQEYHQITYNKLPPPPATPSSSSAPSSSSSLQQDVSAMGDQEMNYSVLQALCSKHMLLLFITTACGIGGIMTVVDNMSQIGQSVGHSQRTISMLVSLVSLSNYAGRVLAGLGSDYVVECYKLPRPLVLTMTLLLAFFGHLLIALGLRDGLYVASLIMGFCLGSIWTVLFAVVSEVFGLKHFSTLYNLSTLASPVGSYVLSVQVAGRMYDHEAQRQGHLWQDLACVGVQCFRASFEIIAGVTLLGMVVSLVMTWRTRAFYHARFSDAGGGGVAITAVVTIDKNIKQQEGLADQNKTLATSQSLSIC